MKTSTRSGSFARWMNRPSVSPAAVLWLTSIVAMWVHYGWRLGVATAIGLGLGLLTLTASD